MSDCPHCRTFALEANALHEEIAGLNAEILKKVRECAALRAMLTKQRRQEDVSKHVMAVARMWKTLCSPRASIAPSGKNAENIRVAFINYCHGDPAQRRRLLYDCVRGYALRPYDAGFGRRTANPAGVDDKGAVRRVTTAYIFASEERIEQGASYYRLVQAKPLEWKMAAWNAAMGVEALWRTIALEESQRLDAAWRTRQPLNAATPEHLLLDETPAQVAPAPVAEPGRLFVIEGGREAA